jgi:hypothetical protein
VLETPTDPLTTKTPAYRSEDGCQAVYQVRYHKAAF